MPVELPDINILIALLDVRHQHHEVAEAWFAATDHVRWATCAFTQNGCVRIISNPNYAGLDYTVAQAVDALQTLISRSSQTHEFWAETVSICDSSLFDRTQIAGPKQIADVYLLGLCQQRRERWLRSTSEFLSPPSTLRTRRYCASSKLQPAPSLSAVRRP